MKTKILTQIQKPHNTNRLHDAFIAATLVPLSVDSTELESRFVFADEAGDSAIQAVIDAYSFAAPSTPVDIKVAFQSYKTAVNNATTIPQIKAAITNELGVLLKELFKRSVGDLN